LLDRLLQGNLNFRNHFSSQKDLFTKLLKGQRPKTLWIGCSDSRVIPEIITGSNFGDLFVIRNIANIVTHDAAVASAIEYALEHLNVPSVVVCGHTNCGGIKSLSEIEKLRDSSLKEWLKNAEPALKRLKVIMENKGVAFDPCNATHQRDLVISNVLFQTEVIRKNYLKNTHLPIYSLLYDLENGCLTEIRSELTSNLH